MQRTAVSKRYVRFAENVALGELGLLVFVGAVFLLMGSRSVSEIGVGFMVAGFGLSIQGTVSVARSVENSASGPTPSLPSTMPTSSFTRGWPEP